MKVVVYAIAKNEEAFVERWMRSLGEADQVVVTDTGSTDHTVERLKASGATVYQEKIEPWRFDTARNRSLAHVPQETAICVCTDLDEVLTPGWRKKLEKAWRPGTQRASYWYNWSHLADGSPGVRFLYGKIHARKGYHWAYPVHEYIVKNQPGAEQQVFVEGMTLDHYPDPQKSRSNYLPLLERAVKDEPACERMWYYLGREYSFNGRWIECKRALSTYLHLPTARWKEERAAAMRLIAASYWNLQNIVQAYVWYYRAIAEVPGMRDAYVDCALMAYALKDWPQVFFLVEEALQITERSASFINESKAWDYTLDDLGALACQALGMKTKACIHAQNALQLQPDDPRLQENLRILKEWENT